MTTNLGWLVFLLVGCLVWLAWAWQRHQHPASHPAAVTARVQRLLKPRTPDDCPACRQQAAAPAAPDPLRAAVPPWRERKSRRGAPKRIETQGFACPKRTCAVLSDHRCARACPLWRWDAWKSRTHPDLSLLGLWHDLQRPPRYAAVSAQNLVPATRGSADGTLPRALCRRRGAGVRPSPRDYHHLADPGRSTQRDLAPPRLPASPPAAHPTGRDPHPASAPGPEPVALVSR
jgi:hypothetical protein